MSTIPVAFPEGASATQVHASIRERLREGAHWGTSDCVEAARSQGLEGARRELRVDYDRPGHAWFPATFSNLGDRTIAGCAPRHHFFFAPPVSVVLPIGAGSVGWGGRVALTLQLHAALGADSALAQRLVVAWRSLLLEASAAG